MIENLENRIEVILDLCRQANELIPQWGKPEQKMITNVFWEQIKALNADAGLGLQPGKHVRFSVGGAYAHYIVKKVGRTTCRLVHIPYMDAYKSNFVNEHSGEVETDEIKPKIEFEEGLKMLFELRRQRRNTVAAE